VIAAQSVRTLVLVFPSQQLAQTAAGPEESPDVPMVKHAFAVVLHAAEGFGS
jgi:hypothetical protein